MNPLDILLQCLDIILESHLWQDKKPSEVFKILMYLHQKQWLYIPTVNGKIKAVIAAYRINDVSEESLRKMPTDEKGKILYIPLAISLNKEDNIYKVARESLNIYLQENQDIEEIVLEDKNDKLKRYKIGDKNGRLKESTATSNAAIL